MRRSIATAVIAGLAALLMPHASSATPACRVLFDPAGDVAGPLGAPRPEPRAGRAIDLTGITLNSSPQSIIATIAVADLSAAPTTGTANAFYTVFWSLGSSRYFAQASHVAGAWTFTAGPAASLDDAIPQQGTPVNGAPLLAQHAVRIYVPRDAVGAPEAGAMLQQIRAGSTESVWRPAMDVDEADLTSSPGRRTQVAATNDRAGGPEGGRFLVDMPCLPSLSGAGERCLVVTDRSADATGGRLPNAAAETHDTPAGDEVRDAQVGAVDPATEILSLQMGSNPGTLIVEIGVASLSRPVPNHADAERWDVSWVAGDRVYSAFAERRDSGPVFGYTVGGRATPTTGSIDRSGGAVRILVPRHEIRAEDVTRMTSVMATSALVFGALADPRDNAPENQQFSSQYVAGVGCQEQAKAACPVVLDPVGDAGRVMDAEGRSLPEEQPASDVSAAGLAAPDGSLVATIRIQDVGAPPPDGFETHGWTLSWTYEGVRYFAQAERSRTTMSYTYGALGPAADYAAPSGPSFRGTETTGHIDIQASLIRIEVPRAGVGSPADGRVLGEVGVHTFVKSPKANGNAVHSKVDDTAVAPYRVGLSCGA